MIYGRCVSCHRPDGAAMSLLTYEEARPWAKAIRDEVANRRMPPWDAVRGVGQFRDDPSLSQAEIDLLVSWVEGGAPEGDPAYAPSLPQARTPVAGQLAQGAEQGTVLRESTTLSAPMMLADIHPEGPVELTAVLPDRTVRHLIWIPAFRPEWNRTYRLRTPLRLPKGTRLLLTGSPVRLSSP